MLITARRTAAAQSGFTLVELLVAMSCAIVVMFALTGILITTMHQSRNTFTRVDATRQARTALANIENELHSACVNGSPPIQGVTGNGTVESDDNDLVFVSYYGTSDSPQATWHQISYSPASHTLVDNRYSATYVSGSSGGSWTPSGSPTSVTLLSNVLPQSGTPIFRYFDYQPTADGRGNWYWTVPDGSNVNPVTGTQSLSPLATPLSSSDAQQTVEVTISMLVGPTDEGINNTSQTSTLGDPVSDTISLRLTTPPDYTAAGASNASYLPCE